MSDDRYDQDGGTSGQSNSSSPEDEEYAEDAKTQLVDLDSLERGTGESDPEFAPPPTMDSSEEDGFDHSEFAGPDQTQEQDNPIQSSLPSDGDEPFEGGGSSVSSVGSAHDDASMGGNLSSVDADDASMGGGVSSSADEVSSSVSSGSDSGGGQVVIGDGPDDAGHDEATQFINVNDFADQQEEEAHFTPEQEEAGYDGSTQFVDINALQAGDEAMGGDPIDNDEDLHRGYQFEARDIHRGDTTLVEAKNALGKDVILKRVWEGDPESMSTPVRERIAELNELEHPGLMQMNGMFVSDSGMWIEIDAPSGQRLSELIQQHGPLTTDTVLEFVDQIAEVLEYVHGQHLAYANLTPEAVWIEEETVRLEPFDMLRIEERGDLGPYGPPEMQVPPEERELSPATDVYCLAATTAAALTGVPLRAENLEHHDDQDLVDVLVEAMSEELADRPQTVDEFVDDLEGGGLDIKIVGAVVFSILLLATAGLALVADGDDPAPAAEAEEAVVEQGDVEGEVPSPDDDSAGLADEADEQAPDVELPDTVTEDPRLTVESSYDTNPPDDLLENVDETQLEQWRNQAEQLEDEAEDAASDSERLDDLLEAMRLRTRVLETTESDDEDDLAAWRQLYERDIVRDELEDRFDDVEDAVLAGDLAVAQRHYRQVDDLDPRTGAMTFFSLHGNVDIVELERKSDDEDEDDRDED